MSARVPRGVARWAAASLGVWEERPPHAPARRGVGGDAASLLPPRFAWNIARLIMGGAGTRPEKKERKYAIRIQASA